MTSQLSLIYTTFPNQEDALSISHALLEKHLIACVNILGEIKSLYIWEKHLEESKEVAALLKTLSKKVPQVIEVLQDLHPYETPAILEIPVDRAGVLFSGWVEKSVR